MKLEIDASGGTWSIVNRPPVPVFKLCTHPQLAADAPELSTSAPELVGTKPHLTIFQDTSSRAGIVSMRLAYELTTTSGASATFVDADTGALITRIRMKVD